MNPNPRLEPASTIGSLNDSLPRAILGHPLPVPRVPSSVPYSLDLESANKRLTDCRYFLIDHPEGFVTAYCWAVDVEESQVSLLYRVREKATLELIARFDHAEPDGNPYAQALGYEFYFPRVQLRRLSDGRTSTATTVYFNCQDALQAANDWNNFFALPGSSAKNGRTLDLPDTSTKLADNGFQDQQGIHRSQSKQLSSAVSPASEPPSIFVTPLQNMPDYVGAQVDPGNSTVWPPGPIATWVPGLPSILANNIQQPIPLAIPRSAFQPLPSSQPSNLGQADQATAFFNPDPNSMALITPPIMIINGWQPHQILRVPVSTPTIAYVAWISREFSQWMRQHNSDKAVCWHCHHDNAGQRSAPRTGRKLAKKGALTNVSFWYLERHLRAHFGLREFVCPETTCMRGFVTNQQMRKHIKSKHLEIWEGLSIKAT